jgi:hypothetical protein
VPASLAAAQYARLRRSFAVGLSAVVLFLGAAFGLVLTLGTGQHRPSGAAQDWLYDMAGSTASSGRQTSLSQAAKLGLPALAGPLIAPRTTDEEAFTRIVVGRSALADGTATVHFTVVRPGHPRAPPVLAGTLTLHRSATGWHVVAVSEVHQVTMVPAPSSPALPGSRLAWAIGVIVVVVLVAAAASFVIKRAGRGG